VFSSLVHPVNNLHNSQGHRVQRTPASAIANCQCTSRQNAVCIN